MPRGRWEGTVFKRRRYWEGAISLGGQRYWVTGKTRGEVVEKLRALVQRHEMGQLAPPTRLTVGEWCREWLQAGQTRWRPSTLRRREQALSPLLERLGQVRLAKLSPVHLLRALQELATAGVGSRTVQMAYDTLRAALEDAKEMGVIADNPALRTPRPRHEPREAQDWGLEEIRRFLRVALEDDRPLSWGLALMLMTGLRPGEMLGLRAEDVDWDAEALRVRRAIVWAGSQWHEGPPKSRAGARTVALPRLAMEMLARLPRDGWLFWSGERPPRPSAISEAMASLCQRASVPRRPAHYLRHCHASLLLALGVDIKSAQRRLGHATAALTLDVYAHHLPGQERAIAEALDRALNRGREAGLL